ncbi:hypothetical protein ACFFRR_005668 [Megaselia abdita]
MSDDKDIQGQSSRPQCIKPDISEIDNQDFVNRLLAATPPYLYATFSNNFYFSDVLRSLVQSRNNDNVRNIQFQQQIVRRSRKRPWNNVQHKPLDDISDYDKTLQEEKPLELTNKLSSNKCSSTGSKISDGNSLNEEEKECKNDYRIQSNVDIRPETTDSTLSPTNPVWYSSLYPSYGIDPFHFFIDLRVSGHIYDNNKNNTKNSAGTESVYDITNNKKLGSAFSVPTPRHDNPFVNNSNNNIVNSISKINIISSKNYDLNESKENMPNKLSSSTKDNIDYFRDDKPCENLIDVEVIDTIKFKK